MKNKLKENIEFIIDLIKDIPIFIWICISSGGNSYEIERQLDKFEQNKMVYGKKKSDYVKSWIVVFGILLIILYIICKN